MSERFVISDPHFGHENILKFLPELHPFETSAQRDQFMLDTWNETVRPQDVVYLLGDVALRPRIAVDVLRALNGNIRLVLGNHDDGKVNWCDYAQRVYGVRVLGEKETGQVILSHVPVHPMQLEVRYRGNIHGHIHQKDVKMSCGALDPRYINVCAERVGFKPQPLDPLVDRLLKREGA